MGAENKPSETPIVDAALVDAPVFQDRHYADCWSIDKDDWDNFVEHARQLERSNVALRDALEKLAREVAELVSDKTLPEAALSHPSMTQARAALQGGK